MREGGITEMEGEGQRAPGGGLPFSNIIRVHLFSVPREEHPCPLAEVDRSAQSQPHPARIKRHLCGSSAALD